MTDDTFRLAQAAFLCCHAHADHLDKAGKWYALHPLRVGFSLLPDTEAALVGMLHDVLEDTDTPYRMLCEMFGRQTAAQVALLTRHRYEDYFDSYLRSIKNHPLATRVKLADIADNLRPERLEAAATNGHDAERLRAKYERAKAYLEAK